MRTEKTEDIVRYINQVLTDYYHTMELRELPQSQVLLNVGYAVVAPLALGKIRQDKVCRGSSGVRFVITVSSCGLYVLRIAE